jgi:hypothetical protein
MKSNLPPSKPDRDPTEPTYQEIIDETNAVLIARNLPGNAKRFLIRARITFKDLSCDDYYVVRDPTIEGSRLFKPVWMVGPDFEDVYVFSSTEEAVLFLQSTVTIGHPQGEKIQTVVFTIVSMKEDLRARLSFLMNLASNHI